MKPISNNLLKVLMFIFLLALFKQDRVEGQGRVALVRHLYRITEGLKSPVRIAIDSRDIVYVTDTFQAKICMYDTAGKFSGEFTAGESPLAIAITPADLVYVGDRHSGTFQLLNSSGGVIKLIPHTFKLPSYAAFDDENRLYIIDSQKKVVTIFDESSNQVGSFGDDILAFPTGIAFDKKNQRILIVEHGGLSFNNHIIKMIHAFDKQGNWLTSFGEYGEKAGQFSRIQGIAVDSWGKIYVADSYQGVIIVLKENGEMLTTIGQFGRAPGELRAPMDMAIDSQRRLWVTSMNNGCVEVYDIRSILDEKPPDADAAIPSESELLQNYPNPFNPATYIPFRLANDNEVTIRIYNEIGKLVRFFDLGKRQSGEYISEGQAIFWDGNDSQGNSVATGIYFYEIRAGNYVAVRRMALLK